MNGWNGLKIAINWNSWARFQKSKLFKPFESVNRTYVVREAEWILNCPKN